MTDLATPKEYTCADCGALISKQQSESTMKLFQNQLCRVCAGKDLGKKAEAFTPKVFYPAPSPMPLSFLSTDPKLQKSSAAAESMTDFEVYRPVKNGTEFVLKHDSKIYHILYDREMGSCACPDFVFRSGQVALPCKHILKVRSIHSENEEYVHPIPAEVRAIIQTYCEQRGVGYQISEPPDETMKITKPERTTLKPPIQSEAGTDKGVTVPAISGTKTETERIAIFSCYKCSADITADQRNKTFAKNGKALCSQCETDFKPETKQIKPSQKSEQKHTPEIKTEPAKPKGRSADGLIPAKTYAPQGQIIKGFVPQLKEIGKIKIGTKGEMKESLKGTHYRPPIKFDHFEVVGITRDKNGLLMRDMVMDELGLDPKELDIMLLYNDPTLNFVTRYSEYKGGKCQCWGDGITAKRNGETIECNPEQCETLKDKRCKPNGILSVILMKSPRLGGVYKFRTTSYNSIRSILSSLFFIRSLTGGTLAMIPLKLTVSPMTVQPKDSPTAQTIYVVNIEFHGTAQELLQKTFEVSQYQQIMRANIQQLEATARVSLLSSESEEECEDIEAEFYCKEGWQ